MDRSMDSASAPSKPSPRTCSGEAESAADMIAGGQVFDYRESLARLGGDRELFDELLVIFLEDAPSLLVQASAALVSGDSRALERTSHTLKGLSANFSATAAMAAANDVELHARAQRLDSAAICFPLMEAEVHRLENAIVNFRRQQSCHD